MAYDEKLAERIRKALAARRDVSERKMFGGIAFMVRGHMACGIATGDLMVRVGKEGYEDALARPHARPMDFTGRPLEGYVFVAPAGIRTPAGLRFWVALACANAEALPAKKKQVKKQAPRFPPKKSRGR
jgi:TfoX/Sxy family transcriptional regulator of competence genes